MTCVKYVFIYFFIHFQYTRCSEQEILAAKIHQIEKWKENHVFEQIYYNGQKTKTTRWVLTEKFVNGKKIIKARLAARGSEEDSSEILKDSPTCTKESYTYSHDHGVQQTDMQLHRYKISLFTKKRNRWSRIFNSSTRI